MRALRSRATVSVATRTRATTARPARRAVAFVARLVALAAFAVAAPPRAGVAAPETLRQDASVAARLARGVREWTRVVEVGPDAKRLVALLDSRDDVALTLRGPGPARVSIRQTRRCVVREPAAGAWTLVVENEAHRSGGAYFTVLVATDDAERPPLLDASAPLSALASGGEVPPVRLPGAGALRVLVPAAPRTVVLSARLAAGAALTLDGLGASQRLVGTDSVVAARLDRGDDGAAVVRTLAYAPPPDRPDEALDVTARLGGAKRDDPFGGATLVPGEPLALSFAPERRDPTDHGGHSGGPNSGEPGSGEPRTEPGPKERETEKHPRVLDGVRFRFHVPPEALGVVLTTTGGGDVDLFVWRVAPEPAEVARLTPERSAEYLALGVGDEERLVLRGTSGLPEGEYAGLARAGDADARFDATLAMERLDDPAGPTTFGAGRPPLAVGTFASGLLPADEPIAWFPVAVPAPAASFHAQLLGAGAGLDLVVARGETGAIFRRAQTAVVEERLEFAFDLAAGSQTLWVGVLPESFEGEPIEFRLGVGVDRNPVLPADLRLPPFHLGADLTPVERAAEATVELEIADRSGGSGCLVSPHGLVLTSRHVLVPDDVSADASDDPAAAATADRALQREGVLVALPDDFSRPPRQLYLADVLEDDEDLDLALLRIVSDVYGRPFPRTQPLPYLRLSSVARPRLGDPLTVIGYPADGSERERTGVIVVKGAVAGLEKEPVGDLLRWLKTDAWIASGHSGGPVLDADLRVVAISTAVLGEGRGLGLARPVARLPDEWKILIEKDLGE